MNGNSRRTTSSSTGWPDHLCPANGAGRLDGHLGGASGRLVTYPPPNRRAPGRALSALCRTSRRQVTLQQRMEGRRRSISAAPVSQRDRKTEYDRKIRPFLDAQASILAQALEEGLPCGVRGGPSPALARLAAPTQRWSRPKPQQTALRCRSRQKKRGSRPREESSMTQESVLRDRLAPAPAGNTVETAEVDTDLAGRPRPSSLERSPAQVRSHCATGARLEAQQNRTKQLEQRLPQEQARLTRISQHKQTAEQALAGERVHAESLQAQLRQLEAQCSFPDQAAVTRQIGP